MTCRLVCSGQIVHLRGGDRLYGIDGNGARLQRMGKTIGIWKERTECFIPSGMPLPTLLELICRCSGEQNLVFNRLGGVEFQFSTTPKPHPEAITLQASDVCVREGNVFKIERGNSRLPVPTLPLTSPSHMEPLAVLLAANANARLSVECSWRGVNPICRFVAA